MATIESVRHESLSAKPCNSKCCDDIFLSNDCDHCHLIHECGGLDDLDRAIGCFSACRQRHCGMHFRHNGLADWICLCNKEGYIQAVRETGGLNFKQPKIEGPSELNSPLFVPTVHHRSSRRGALSAPIVALPLPRVLSFVRRTTAPLTPQALRDEFRVAADARIILLCTCVDKFIELLWAIRRTENIASKFGSLGIWAATAPNYSFFVDAPRPDMLINRRRSLIVGGEWTDAGIPVIPHLNAITISDWKYWLTLLKNQPNITYISKEFQTGLHSYEKGFRAVEQLAYLQDGLGREIRPIIVGGTKYLPLLARYFDHPTFIESAPFMMSTKRQKILLSPRDVSPARRLTVRREACPTELGESIDELLHANIVTRQLDIESAWAESKRSVSLNFGTSERRKTKKLAHQLRLQDLSKSQTI